MKFEKDDIVLRKLAEEVMKEKKNLRDLYRLYENDEIRIGFQWSDKSKTENNKTTYGDCEKVKPKLKEFIKYDFIITFYADAQCISDNAKRILMYHELRHVGFGLKENGQLVFSIIPHDIEDFVDIIDDYGKQWVNTI